MEMHIIQLSKNMQVYLWVQEVYQFHVNVIFLKYPLQVSTKYM